MMLLSRRSFLGGAAVFRTKTFVPQANKPHRIDVHFHITPPAFLSFLAVNGQARPIEWTLSKSLEDMEEGGTATALTSITSPGIWFGGVEGVRKVARDCNDYAAKLRSDYPGRFGIFATLPLPDIEGSVRETAYAMDTLKADGVCMWTNYEDKWLGDKSGSNPPKNAPNGVLAEIRKMYYDVAQSSNPVAMRALRSVVPVSQIVFGTDYPYRSTSEHVKGLLTGKVFSAQELQAIDRENAVRLLPRYRS